MIRLMMQGRKHIEGRVGVSRNVYRPDLVKPEVVDGSTQAHNGRKYEQSNSQDDPPICAEDRSRIVSSGRRLGPGSDEGARFQKVHVITPHTLRFSQLRF